MGAQPNNSTNNNARSKKYDAYTPRRGSFRVSERVSAVDYAGVTNFKKNVPQTKPDTNYPQANTQKTGITYKTPKSAYNQGAVLQNQSPRTRVILDRPDLVSSGSNSQSKKIALFAVKQSNYTDESSPSFSTIYASAKQKKTIFQKMLYGFASLVVVFSGFVSVQSFILNNKAQEQIATLGENTTRDEQGVSEGTGNDPSEEPISEAVVRNYQVTNPEDPRFLRIPSLGVFSRIKNLGVTPQGAVDAPKNIHDTGWYNGSARPGSRVGSSLILGHVSGWTGPGVFKKINQLPVGGEFEIEKGTGEVVRYSVTRSEKIPLDQVDMGKVLSTEVAGEHDLKLMTCSGRYNSATETYEDRFIVYAKKI